MGTSTSSAGAGSGTAFDPPWLSDDGAVGDGSLGDTPIGPPTSPDDASDIDATDSEEGGNADGAEGGTDTNTPYAGATAPPRRYAEARRRLTRFIESGDQSQLKRGLSSFVKKGLGGSARAAGRMRTTAGAASALGGFLSAVRDGTNPSITAWVTSAKARGLSANDAALEVVNQLVPAGGSIDEESAKHAMTQAIAHLYEVEPLTDIFNLSDDQIANLMSYTIAFDVFNRLQLELGRVFEKLKYSAALIHERLNQALDYVLAVVSGAMAKVRGAGGTSMREVANKALNNALEVFGTP